jgi:hypothetical protein
MANMANMANILYNELFANNSLYNYADANVISVSVMDYISGQFGSDYVDTDDANNAVIYGHLCLLKWLHKCKNITPNIDCLNAINAMNIDVLRYLIEDIGLIPTAETANKAAAIGALNIVRYLRENGVRCSEKGVIYAARNGHLDVLCDLRERDGLICKNLYSIARNGHLHILKNIYENDFSAERKISFMNDNLVANEAAREGHLDVVKYLRDVCNLEANDLGVDFAAFENRLEIIKDTFENNILVKPSQTTADYATHNGYLDIIKYLHSVGITCSNKGADYATFNGHLHVIKYLHEVQHIDCTQDGLQYSINKGYQHIVDYLQTIDIVPVVHD